MRARVALLGAFLVLAVMSALFVERGPLVERLSAQQCPQGYTLTGGVCVASPTLSGGLWFPWGAQGYTPGFHVIAGQSVAKGGTILLVNAQSTVALKHVNIYILSAASSNCGAGGTSACGLVVAIYPLTLTAPLCTTTVAVGGGSQNINATGLIALSFASGSDVSGSVCTLPGGTAYYLIASTDSTAVAWGTADASGKASLLMTGTNSAGYGAPSTAISTGAGAALVITTNLSAITWVAYNVSTAVLGAPSVSLDGN